MSTSPTQKEQKLIVLSSLTLVPEEPVAVGVLTPQGEAVSLLCPLDKGVTDLILGREKTSFHFYCPRHDGGSSVSVPVQTTFSDLTSSGLRMHEYAEKEIFSGALANL